mmetsp:Transcript_6871/g.12506  ORF Transcript_6871/g.12506 Transcript_6871/m.12506 type:complete len:215 (-) Transcript_6871:13-657(-)
MLLVLQRLRPLQVPSSSLLRLQARHNVQRTVYQIRRDNDSPRQLEHTSRTLLHLKSLKSRTLDLVSQHLLCKARNLLTLLLHSWLNPWKRQSYPYLSFSINHSGADEHDILFELHLILGEGGELLFDVGVGCLLFVRQFFEVSVEFFEFVEGLVGDVVAFFFVDVFQGINFMPNFIASLPAFIQTDCEAFDSIMQVLDEGFYVRLFFHRLPPSF